MQYRFVGFVWGTEAARQRVWIQTLSAMLGADLVEIFEQQDIGRYSKWEELEEAYYATRSLILENVGRKEKAEVYLMISTVTGDRIGISRNVKVLTLLAESGVDYFMCDRVLPGVDALLKSDLPGEQKALMAVEAIDTNVRACQQEVAEYLEKAKAWSTAESERKKAEMAERMKSGWTPTLKKSARKAGNEANRKAANDAYGDIAPQILAWREEGVSQQAIADKLNQEGHRTRTGKEFSAVQVMRILKRLQKGG